MATRHYEARTFDLPSVQGISKKTLDLHLGLYNGYVTNLTAHYTALDTLQAGDPDPLIVSALIRRIQFELAGAQNHERYFESLVGGPAPCGTDTALHGCIVDHHGSLDSFLNHLRQMGSMMRGIGWIMVVYDPDRSALHTFWVTDQELGNVNLPAVLAIDMWEHSYLLDYPPAEKGSYVDAYLSALNWTTLSDRFASLIS